MGAKPVFPPGNDLSTQIRDGLFDFKHTASFAENYLKTFYGDRAPTNDERVVFRFLTDHAGRLADCPVLLEVGCGPTVHHIFPFAHYVSEIHMADYLDENLVEVSKWRDNATGAGNWAPYAELALSLDARPCSYDDVRHLEHTARRKLRHLVKCDLRHHWILGGPAQYRAVTAFYCTEEVGITTARWEEVMANLARVVEPGGHLFLSCLRDTDSYVVGGTSYPCARISELALRQILPRLGFDMTRSIVQSATVEGQEDEGVIGVVLAAAQKAG